MKRYTSVILLALLALVLNSCSERDASLVDISPGTSLAFAPRFVYLGNSQTFAPVNAIRLTARNVASNAIVATVDTTVNPADVEWDLRMSVPPDAGTVIVLIELLNRANGVETVEWSGFTAPIEVIPGGIQTPATVQLFQGPPVNLQVTSVTIAPEGFTVPEGTSRGLAATVLPAGVAFWSSLDPAVATVDAAGNVLALRNGTARIVAVAGPRADTVVVTATAVVTAVDVTPDTIRVTALGADAVFTGAGRDARGAAVADAALNWTIADAAIASNTGNGRFRALTNGTTTVRATSVTNAALTDAAVLIVSQRAGRLAIAPTNGSIAAIGGTLQFTATPSDANGNPMPATPIAWRSANPAIATVNANGLASAVTAGATEIIAVANAGSPDSVVARATLLVNQAASTITVLPADTVLTAFGHTVRLRAEARDANGNVMQNVTFTWTSANPAIASVDATGLVTAVGNGTNPIFASIGAARGTANVVVAQAATAVEVTPATDSINAGSTTQLTAAAFDATGHLIEGATFTWTSSDTTIAVVSSTGVVTGRVTGSVTVTAQSGAAAGTAAITVLGSVELPNLIFLSVSTTPDNPLVEGQPVTVSMTIKNNSPTASTATTVTVALYEASEQPGVLFDTIVALPGLAAGQTLIVTQTFTLRGAADFPESVYIGATLDPENTVAESVETDNFRQTETKTIQFVQYSWTGAASTDWHNPMNWSPVDVPHARSPVLIPAAPANDPVIARHADILSLTQEAGSSLDILAGAVLTVRGSVAGASIEGDGKLRLASTPYEELAGNVVALSKASANAAPPAPPTVNGTVDELVVEHAVALNGFFQTNGLTSIAATGAVYVGAYHFSVESKLESAGVLDMTDPAAIVVVHENAEFNGGASTVGHLTAGMLTVRGDFSASGANAFAASGTHLTVFGSGTPTEITMTGEIGQHFHNVRNDKTAPLTIESDVRVNGTFTIAATANLVNSTATVTIGGDLIDLAGEHWLVDTTVFTGSPSFPTHMLHNVKFTGQAQLSPDPEANYTIDGNLFVTDGGNLNFNSIDLSVGGSLYTQTGGTITMQAGETLEVDGNASFDGGSTNGKLQYGKIDVNGNFFAGTTAAFAACADCDESGLTLWMRGTTPTTITMNNSNVAATGNHFGNLYIANTGGVTVLSDIAIAGELDFGSVESELTELTDGEGFFTVTLGGDLEDDAHYGRNFRVANLILLDSEGTLPLPDPETGRVELYTNLTFAGSGVHELVQNVHVYGNVAVRNGELNIDGQDLLLDGDFLTIEGGSLRMPSCDCSSSRLRVMGNATFSGGNNTDDAMLAYGTLYVGGNFTAAANSYHASMYHVTKMYDYVGNGEERTITLTNPGLGVGQQHFGTLRIRRPTRLESDIAVVGHIELDGGDPLIGVARTAVVAGDIVEPTFDCEFCCEGCEGGNVMASRTSSDHDATPLAYGARYNAAAAAARSAARPKIAAQKPTGLRKAPAFSGPPAANIAASTFDGLYQVDNTVLAGGFQSLPVFLETNIRVVSEVTLYTPFDDRATLVLLGNLVVDGAGGSAELRLADLTETTSSVANVQISGNFETRNGGTLQMGSPPCECSPALFVSGDITFDGGSQAGKLTGGNISAGRNFTTTLANPLSFISDGTEVYFNSLVDDEEPTTQTLTIANPETQSFANIFFSSNYSSSFVIPNGMTVRGYFQASGPMSGSLLISGGGRLYLRPRPDTYSAFFISQVRFDGIRLESEVEGVAYATVFGTYPANVDQVTLRIAGVIDESPLANLDALTPTVYMDGLTFMSQPDASHYHLRATGDIQVDILNVTPATAGAGARWRADNGANVMWGNAPNIGVADLSLDGPLYVNDVLSINTYGYLNNGNSQTLPPFVVRMQVYDAQTNTRITSIPNHNVTATSANWDELTDVYIPIASDLWEQHPQIKVRWIIDVTDQVDETNESDNVFFTPVLDITPSNNNRVAAGAVRRAVPAPQPRTRPAHPKALQ